MRVTIRIVACAVLWTVAGYATLPVSFRLEPKTVLANPPAMPTLGAVQDDPKADSLPAQVAVRLGTARYRHGSRIESMAVSADGKLGVTASGFGSFNPALVGRFSPARVFDLTDGRCLYSLPNEPGSYTEAVGLSPDGTTLATKDDKFLCLRDAATGKELRKLEYLSDSGGSRSITDWMTFTPDGKQVAVTLMGKAVQLIDVGNGEVTRTFAPGAAASACVFSPDGKLMATGGYDLVEGVYCARLWEVGTGKELRLFPAVRFPAGNGLKRALAFSPDGATLAGGGWGDARLRLWETATGKEPKNFPKIGEDIVSVAFAPDGKTVAAAADNIYLYDPDTGKERLRIERRARGLAFSRDGSVLTGAVSGAIYRWDAASGRQLTPAAAQDSAVEQILVSADGQGVFTTDQDGDLYMWDAAGGKSPRRIAGGIERGVVASPDGRFLAWAVEIDSRTPDPSGRKWYQLASRVRLYDVAGQRVIDRLPGFADLAAVAGFLPDGKTLLTLGGGFGDATVRLWDVESGKELRSFAVVAPKSDTELPGASRASAGMPFYTTRRAALSPDGKTLAIGPDWEENLSVNHDEPVRLWDVATGKAGPELNKPENVLSVPDEAGLGKDMHTPQVRVNWHMKSADGRAFSPDGRLLVDWAENPFGRSRMDHVVVWDAATGRVVATLAAGPRPGAATRRSRPTDVLWPPPRRTALSGSGRLRRGRFAPSSADTGTESLHWRLARTAGCTRADSTPSSLGGTPSRHGARPVVFRVRVPATINFFHKVLLKRSA